MRIKNENITIKPFTIEYTKERVEWEEKQCEKYKKATFITSWIIMVSFVAALIYAIAWALSNTVQKISGSFLPIVLTVFFLVIVLLVAIYNEYSIEDLASIPVRKLMKWNYVPHYDCPSLIQKIGSAQEMWKQIVKSIKEGSAEVELSEWKYSDRIQLVLNIKYEDSDKNMKEKKFMVSNESNDKKKEDLLISDSLTISFFDIKNENLAPYLYDTYVYVS